MAVIESSRNGGELVGITQSFARRIDRVVAKHERQPIRMMPQSGRRGAGGPDRISIRGVLDNQLTRTGEATMSVTRWDGANDVDTGEDITVYGWMLKPGLFVAAGKRVWAQLDLASGRYYVISAECP